MNDLANPIIASLVVSSIIGNVVMYRQVGVLQQAVTNLTDTVEQLTRTTDAIEAKMWHLR